MVFNSVIFLFSFLPIFILGNDDKYLELKEDDFNIEKEI